eukprot:CAMPEP_0119078540 /NCGR_PEP_ID=MMETSP1178-20130426/101527_1 /TAXON_ID=33656 /ORGANISM="unid sp, Strain CCMP2000" /LENGTH=138 /DNA_ID=CAMNT_0007060993 /DNA_START=39 /DNA_END=455 /DNA_ORIENTATION=-
MTAAQYESPEVESAGSARDLLAKFDKIENPNSPGRKPKSPTQKAPPKDIYKPATLGETPPEGKGVSSNPFLQIDKEVKRKEKEESSSTTSAVFGKSAKATSHAIQSWSTKFVKQVRELQCFNLSGRKAQPVTSDDKDK